MQRAIVILLSLSLSACFGGAGNVKSSADELLAALSPMPISVELAEKEGDYVVGQICDSSLDACGINGVRLPTLEPLLKTSRQSFSSSILCNYRHGRGYTQIPDESNRAALQPDAGELCEKADRELYRYLLAEKTVGDRFLSVVGYDGYYFRASYQHESLREDLEEALEAPGVGSNLREFARVYSDYRAAVAEADDYRDSIPEANAEFPALQWYDSWTFNFAAIEKVISSLKKETDVLRSYNRQALDIAREKYRENDSRIQRAARQFKLKLAEPCQFSSYSEFSLCMKQQTRAEADLQEIQSLVHYATANPKAYKRLGLRGAVDCSGDYPSACLGKWAALEGQLTEQQSILTRKKQSDAMWREVRVFRSGIQSGDSSHCGLVIEVSGKVVRLQTGIGEYWMKKAELFPPKFAECSFVNNIYQQPELAWSVK